MSPPVLVLVLLEHHRDMEGVGRSRSVLRLGNIMQVNPSIHGARRQCSRQPDLSQRGNPRRCAVRCARDAGVHHRGPDSSQTGTTGRRDLQQHVPADAEDIVDVPGLRQDLR